MFNKTRFFMFFAMLVMAVGLVSCSLASIAGQKGLTNYESAEEYGVI